MKNKFAFKAKKRQENGFYGVFKSALKRFGILLYDSDDAQIYKMAFQLDPQGVPRMRTANLLGKICVLSYKNLKKIGFFGVLRAALNRFGIVLYDSDDAQTYRLAFQLDAQVFTTIKTETLGEKLRFEPKIPQKSRLSGVYMAALKRFGIVMYDSDDAQIYRMAFELDAQGDPTLKRASFF